MQPSTSKKILILGAGIAGISAAYHAKLQGNHNALILEKSMRAGGLLNNFEVEGFRFDQAIHLSFTKDEYVRSVFDEVPHYAHYPDVYCYETPHWLKHPVQNNLFQLSIEERVSLIKSFFSRPDSQPQNFYEWLVHQYGEEIANRYPVPYTKKYWATEPVNLGLDWISGRMRRASADEILHGSMTSKTGNGYYAQEMRYPKEGGYRAFIEPLLKDLNIHLSKHVVAVDVSKRIVKCADGSEYGYDYLVNTLPLPLFVEMLKDVPATIREAAKTLWATQVDLLSVGISKPDAVPHLWFYLYDEGLLPARAYSVGHKSPSNIPTGCSAIQFEIYSSPRRPLAINVESLNQHVLEILDKLGIAKQEDVIFVDHRSLPYGNVVFDLGMEDTRNIVREYLYAIGVLLAGRFGEWEYYWSDQAFMSGKNAVEKILL
ncbi:hypothetical protein EKD00_08745 [Chlorobium phaeovibrioides]|uniref:protoporphyrinogen/coproporphyrinogen oxidase n=1 Tax=Chlorobium phaeovibrioides TaxID=1094 RepID=UPI000F82D431|nr:FAD-dependent oxidoreductase [Chlorobium phaeovibrioides]RTY34142.1 hypothetical protein EKD00_08745 [Chlorobium phaeovibrioides]